MANKALSYEKLEELVRISGKAIQSMRNDIAKLKGHLANVGITVDDQCNIIASTASSVNGPCNAIPAQQQSQHQTGSTYSTDINAFLIIH